MKVRVSFLGVIAGGLAVACDGDPVGVGYSSVGAERWTESAARSYGVPPGAVLSGTAPATKDRLLPVNPIGNSRRDEISP